MVAMKRRYLQGAVEEVCFANNKMAFISGPRQVGKTTLAKWLLKQRGSGKYYNWDQTEFRRQWVTAPSSLVEAGRNNEKKDKKKKPIIIFDEIHKAKYWKRTLKGIYDTLSYPVDIVVTGSARLAVYRRGSDSLVGRYYHLRLHPFTLSELISPKGVDSDTFFKRLFNRSISYKKEFEEYLSLLFSYSGFPEPLLAQNNRTLRLWRQSRIERVIREDLRDLSRIPELSQIEMLAAILPERVGSPVSLTRLSLLLEVSHATIRRWLNYLSELYYIYEVTPYHKNIARALKKSRKYYLWDYTEISDTAARFENLIAVHLLKSCDYWTDTGQGVFKLFYLRDKSKHEIDFLITKDGVPWLPVEVKLNEVLPSTNWDKFSKFLSCPYAIQIVRQPGYWKVYQRAQYKLLVASASEVLSYFV
ncbi:MAG: ATP-binding protein [Candidatus Dadabacteria bacterium]|nr:MAG: ATP-binding protein [Candidatus Dadabacteria bacterium]